VSRAPPLDTAAIEQNVDSVTVVKDRRDQGGDVGGGGEVCDVDCGLAAERLNSVFGGSIRGVSLWDLLESGMLKESLGDRCIYLNEEDVSACFCESHGH